MASSKNIEIKISAVGGDQAAAQIGKLGTASEAAAGAVQKMSRADLLGPELAAKFDSLRENAEKLTHAVDDTGGSLEENVGQISMLQKAEAVSQFAQAFGQLSQLTGQAADSIREVDPELAKTLDGASEGLNRVSSAASLAAQGFAVGGPLGAALGAMAGVLLPEFIQEVEALGESLTRLKEAEDTENRLFGEKMKMLRMGPEVYGAAIDAANTYKETTDELTRSLNEQTSALKNRNAVLDAADKADASERDAEDAERIRNGEAPEDVKADRVKYDAQKDLEKGRRQLAELNAEQDAAAKIRDQKQENVRALKNDPRGADPQDISKAQEEADKAQLSYEQATSKALTKLQVFNQDKRRINQDTTNRVSGLQDAKAQRLAREKQAEDEQAARESEKLMMEEQREAERERRERERMDRGSGRRGGGGYGGYGGGFDVDYEVQRIPGFGPSGRPRLSAIEDGQNRAADRQRDRDERAAARQGDRDYWADARQEDREKRGGRKPGSLELLETRADAAMNGQRDQGSEQSGDQERLLALLEMLIARLESNPGRGGSGSDSKSTEEMNKKIDILERRIRNN